MKKVLDNIRYFLLVCRQANGDSGHQNSSHRREVKPFYCAGKIDPNFTRKVNFDWLVYGLCLSILPVQ